MQRFKRPSHLVLLALLLSLFSLGAQAAGKVSFISGMAYADRGGQRLKLSSGTAVRPGDLVRTERDSLLQLRMDDGAIISLRAASQLRIDAYRRPNASRARGGRAVLRLLKGGLRSLTGLIGSLDRNEYALITPVATVGIRGTDFSVLYCDGDCQSAPDGLHARVTDGAIVIIGKSGDSLTLNKGQYGSVADAAAAPERGIKAPTEMILHLPPGKEKHKRKPPPPTVDSKNLFDDSQTLPPPQQKPRPSSRPEPPDGLRPGGESRPFAYAPSGDGSAQSKLGSAGDLSPSDSGLNAFNGLDGRYEIKQSQQTDVGMDPQTGIRWGRWSGGDSTIAGASADLSQSSLAWIVGPSIDGAAALPRNGFVSFTLTGNTNPADNAGNVGFLGSASLAADFTNQTVFSELDLGIANQIWRASGSGDLSTDTGLFSGSYDAVTVDGFGGANGDFAGFIIPGADDLPAGAGLSYSLGNGQRDINGSAAFGNPQPVTPQ